MGYNEKDVAKILRRAAELQEADAEGAFVAHDSTREDILRIATEVGIDPRHVAQALDELGTGDLDVANRGQVRWLGAPEAYTLERSIPGELSPDAWATLVGMLNAEFKQSIGGTVSGRYHSWTWKHDLGQVHFGAVQSGDSIRLKLELQIDEGIVAGLVPTVIAGFAGVSLLQTSDQLQTWFALLLSAGWVVGLGLGFRRVVGGWWTRDRMRRSKLMDRLAATLPGAVVEVQPMTTISREGDNPDALEVRLGP